VGKKSLPDTPGQVFGRRVAEARKRRGLTQKHLAERVSMQRETMTTIENGTRRVTIDEWLAISAALGAPPLHLLIPLDDDEQVTIGREAHGVPRVRTWIRSLLPLHDDDDVVDFLAELPESELASIGRALLTRGVKPLYVALIDPEKLDERVGDIVWEIKEGERIRREEKRQKGDENG
jgi:transcriptional regulator with XRE-family HTH domain